MSREFDANTANRFSAGDTAALDISGTALTLFAWVRPDQVNSRTIVSKRNAAGNTLQYELRLTTSGVYGLVGNGGSSFDDLAGGVSVSTGNWHAVGMVKSGTGAGAQRVYRDGTEDATDTSNVTLGTTNQEFTIGVMGLDTPSFPFDGLIAEVAVWDVALTAIEMLALSRGASPLLFRPQNLQGYWPLHGTGSPERDYSGKGSHATMAGTVAAGTRHAPVMPFLPPQNIPVLVPTTGYTDAAEVYVDLQPSGTDIAEYTDSATVYVDLQASGVEEKATEDAATIYLDLQVLGGECYSSWSGEFLGEGDAFTEFYSTFQVPEWSGVAVPEWSPGEVSIEGAPC